MDGVRGTTVPLITGWISGAEPPDRPCVLQGAHYATAGGSDAVVHVEPSRAPEGVGRMGKCEGRREPGGDRQEGALPDRDLS